MCIDILGNLCFETEEKRIIKFRGKKVEYIQKVSSI